jgi:hypothetical protein
MGDCGAIPDGGIGPLLPAELEAGCDLETDWMIKLLLLPEISEARFIESPSRSLTPVSAELPR